jgi:nickel-dependent lactate racemase
LLIFHTLNARASIHACCKAGRHIVVMEGDKEIFKSLLEPLIVKPVVEVSKKQRLHKVTSIVDDEEEVLPTPKIVPCNRFCK